MRTFMSGIFAGVMIAAVMGSVLASQQGGSTVIRTDTVTMAEYERWKKELSNWGRWGKDDQLGTMNLVTPAKRKQAAALVKEGFSVSLAHDALTEKAADVPSPYVPKVGGIHNDSFHGTHTHFDSLSHIRHELFDNTMYNDYKASEDEVKNGFTRNSIINLKNGVFTRGILIDIPRLKGVKWLEPGTPIFVEDLEAWEKRAGVKVGAGDALFVRTGRWARRAALGPWDTSSGPSGKRAGLATSVIPWLRQRDIAVLSCDIPQSVNPSAIFRAAHDFPNVMLGVWLLDSSDLEAVAEAAAARNRWEFLLTAAPLPLRGNDGSPVNPIATF